jgi:hypothetical protein
VIAPGVLRVCDPNKCTNAAKEGDGDLSFFHTFSCSERSRAIAARRAGNPMCKKHRLLGIALPIKQKDSRNLRRYGGQ